RLDLKRLEVRVPAGVWLDLGATAKALAADRAASAIQATTGCGVLVNLGGDLRVAGDPPEEGWRVGIADDAGFDASTASIEPRQVVMINDGGLATSSILGRASLGLSHAEIVAAVQDAVRAHGDGRAVVEPRVHLVPDNNGAGHFNVLRGHLPTPGPSTPDLAASGLAAPGVSGVKVVGDFVANYAAGLPSELGLLTLYDPETGVPLAIMDATLITACRTGAMTAVGARYLARPDSRVLGHVGARGTAFWNVVLLDEMFDLDEIRITSRRPESREAFAQELATV